MTVPSMKAFLHRRGSVILLGLGIGGTAGTIWNAIHVTPRAMNAIEQRKREEGCEELSVKQTVQTVWKFYISTAIMYAASTACLIGSYRLQERQYIAIATAYGLAESAAKEYQEKVVSTIGEKAEGKILDEIDKDRVERTPPRPEVTRDANAQEVITGDGASAVVLCMDAMFGRYFYSSVDALQRAANKLNWQMNNGVEGYISLNEFYAEIELPCVEIGDELGWRSDLGLIELRFSSQLVNGRTPCLVVSHRNPPTYGYYN